MTPWVTVTEASDILGLYPVTIPDDLDKYINLAFLYLSNDVRYSFPDVPTDKMKVALSLYSAFLGSPNSSRKNAIRDGVSSFRVGSFSESYSQQAQDSKDEYPADVAALLSEYRTGGRGTSIRLTRTFPRP